MQPGRTHEAIGTHSAFMGNPMEEIMTLYTPNQRVKIWERPLSVDATEALDKLRSLIPADKRQEADGAIQILGHAIDAHGQIRSALKTLKAQMGHADKADEGAAVAIKNAILTGALQ